MAPRSPRRDPEARMPLAQHLIELRKRLTRGALAIIGTGSPKCVLMRLPQAPAVTRATGARKVRPSAVVATKSAPSFSRLVISVFSNTCTPARTAARPMAGAARRGFACPS